MMDITPHNPSRKATRRVKNPLPAPNECRYCKGNVSIVNNSSIYGKSYGKWPWLYMCKGCGAYVGMHPFTSIPLGTLADKATRNARKLCKPAFGKLWRGPDALMSRTEAYAWLAEKLEISVDICHFGWFNTETCEIAREECNQFMGNL